MVCAIYSPSGHLGHLTSYTNFSSPFVWMLHMKFGFDWSWDFGVEDVRKV